MDTFIGRAQAGFSKFSTAVSVAALFIGILGYLQLWSSGAFDLTSDITSVKTTLRLHDSWRYGATDGRRKENARFEFDLDADLTPLFNWNTKQVFAYVTVDYDTVNAKTGATIANSVVIWDRIVRSKEDANLTFKRARSKYSVWDVQSKFGGSDGTVQFNLRWNVQPHVGFLTNGETKITHGHVALPERKSKSQSTKESTVEDHR